MNSLRRAIIGSALLSLGLPTTAAARCPIAVENASSTWSEAAASLPDSATGSDCARVVLTGDGADGATLTFTTSDGRAAIRTLAHPDELVPALAALTERGPLPEPPAAEPVRETPPPPTAMPTPQAQPTEEPVSIQAGERSSDDAGSAFVLALQTGARSGSSLMSPVLVGAAAIALERWELGVLVAYEARYYDLEARVPSERQTGALGLGVGAGRREPIGGVDLLAGARTMIATLTHMVEEVDAPAGRGPHEERSALEWRIGAYLGTVAPREGVLRFRAELGVDLVGSDRSTSTVDNVVIQPPIAPEWAITGLIGVELGER